MEVATVEDDRAPRNPARVCAEAMWLREYRPRCMPKQTWAAVEPFVLGCAARLDLAEDRNALRTVRVLAKVAAWCASEGIPLEQEAVLDPATVERFITLR